MLSLATSVLEIGLGHENGVQRLVRLLLQRSALLTPSLVCTSTMAVMEEKVELFRYFKIVDKYYYILVEVSSSPLWQYRDPWSQKPHPHYMYLLALSHIYAILFPQVPTGRQCIQQFPASKDVLHASHHWTKVLGKQKDCKWRRQRDRQKISQNKTMTHRGKHTHTHTHTHTQTNKNNNSKNVKSK